MNAIKIFKISGYSIISLFALIGLFLTGSFFAIKLGITNDPGNVDVNDRYFQEAYNKSLSENLQGDTTSEKIAYIYYKIMVLDEFFPKNSKLILNAFNKNHSVYEAERMFDAVDLYLKDNKRYQQKITTAKNIIALRSDTGSRNNVFDWMNMEEWEVFKEAVVKDKHTIDSVARLTDVEPRLITAMLVGEQIRLFDSKREEYKKWVAPLKILANEVKTSLGVTGIKEWTAVSTEKNLKDQKSPFYIGKKYEHLLDFKTTNIEDERFKRLTDYHDHTYAYLYAALILKETLHQWKTAGFDISRRPEIIATLYNVGFEYSKPKANPEVGGSHINIKGKVYTFGALAYEFYYSGELINEFPYEKNYYD
jgi:hypothetical protein